MAAMPLVSSDPHAHLRPVYRRLASDRTFALVSTEAQFALLVEAEDVRRRRSARPSGWRRSTARADIA